MPCFYSHEIIKGELQDQSAFCTHLEATNNTLVGCALCECHIFVTHASATQQGLPDCPWAALDLSKDGTQVLYPWHCETSVSPRIRQSHTVSQVWVPKTARLPSSHELLVTSPVAAKLYEPLFLHLHIGTKTRIIVILCQKCVPAKIIPPTSFDICRHHLSTIGA